MLRDVARRACEAELLVAVEPSGGDVLGTVTFVPDGGALGEIVGFERVPERDWSPVSGVALLAFAISFERSTRSEHAQPPFRRAGSR